MHSYLYPVHPSTVSKVREAWYPSGAKDDTKDADLLQEILAKHRNHLRPLAPDTKEMRIRQAQVENRKLADERTALANKLKDTLKNLFPPGSPVVQRCQHRSGVRSADPLAHAGRSAQSPARHGGEVLSAAPLP
jgi:hypothetical protein